MYIYICIYTYDTYALDFYFSKVPALLDLTIWNTIEQILDSLSLGDLLQLSHVLQLSDVWVELLFVDNLQIIAQRVKHVLGQGIWGGLG